tara:strand:+ start:886 stop:1749 length:864 start_codon:yes stop_codon:yes gene_type:complete
VDKIVLGSGRRKRQDFQYYRQVKSHLEEIEGKVNKSMVKIAKADADPFPHQCRYYKPCKEIVLNPSHNYGHFKRVHPWTEDEQEFILTLFEESPTGRNSYLLSALYGRSEEELRGFFKSQDKKIPKWGKREKEIEEVHYLINSQIQEVRTNNRIRLEKNKSEELINQYWEREENQVGLLPVSSVLTSEADSLPANKQEIQSQDYLSGSQVPDEVGSKDFYKNLVDALFEKHKYWIEREAHLKTRINELDNQIIELKNKLEEKIQDPEITPEELAEYSEQMNQIYQGF